MSQIWIVENFPSKSQEAIKFFFEMSMQLILFITYGLVDSYLVFMIQVKMLQVQTFIKNDHYLLHKIKKFLLFPNLTLLINNKEKVIHSFGPNRPLIGYPNYRFQFQMQKLLFDLLEC
jgi:hypothetical protein